MTKVEELKEKIILKEALSTNHADRLSKKLKAFEQAVREGGKVEEPDIKNIQELGGELINEVREETSITGIRMNVIKLTKLLQILKEFGYRDDVEF